MCLLSSTPPSPWAWHCHPSPQAGKPPGPCNSLRPITLLTAVRKVLSLVVVQRARPRFESRLPPGQAGARPARSTADGVWTKRMLIALVSHFRIDIHALGTDISQAFDSVDRQALLTFFEKDGWMSSDECRITRLLLSNTTLQIRVGNTLSPTFPSFIGTIQGDALSILVFIGYLAGAMTNVMKAILSPVPKDDNALLLPPETSYVDDVDHISTSQAHLEEILTTTDTVFPLWNLHLNILKTERTCLTIAPTSMSCPRCARYCRTNATCCDLCSMWWHNECAGITEVQFRQFVTDPSAHWVCQTCTSGETPTSRGNEAWRKTKHLGSMLDSAIDIAKRIQHAYAAFATLHKVWLRKELVCEKKRVQLFNAFVLPHFLYNLCAQALTKPLEHRIDTAHRKLLRRLIGVVYPNRISNAALYERTSSTPISITARNARWRYFGHILRRHGEQHPAAIATFAFFRAASRLPHRPNPQRNTLIDVLRADLRQTAHVHGLELCSVEDLEVLCFVAEDRKQWDALSRQVCGEQ